MGDFKILLKINPPSSVVIVPGVLAELVGILSNSGTEPEKLAETAKFDPVLSLLILRMAALAEPQQEDVRVDLSLASALSALGGGLARAAVLACQPCDPPVASWEMGIRVAQLAHDLARHTRTCGAEEAWLSGLLHNLHEYPQFSGTDRRVEWLSVLDQYGFAGDAIRFCRSSPARIRTAPPLVRILQLAVSLVYSGGTNGHLGVVGIKAALEGLELDATELAQLQDRAVLQTQANIHRFSDAATAGASTGLAKAYAALARSADLKELFAVDEPELIASRAKLLMQVLFGIGQTALFKSSAGEIAPVTWWQAPEPLRELHFSSGDMQSVLVHAANGEKLSWRQDSAELFPVVDAQLARMLQASSIMCFPLGGAYVLAAADVGEAAASSELWNAFVHALSANLSINRQASVTPGLPSQFPPDSMLPRQEVRKAVHEASNPLTIIRNYVDLLSGKFSGDGETKRDLAIIGSEIERVANIIQNLGAQPRHAEELEDVPPDMVDVNQAITELIRLSLDTLLLPNKINVQINLDPGLESVPANRDQLKQVLLNLAKNAVEAMPSGGRLSFTTAHVAYKGQSCLVISIADSGPGLSEEVRANLFQPVTSFKGGSHGGLGLAISQNLMQSMGGKIECDSSAAGAVFRIYLPVIQQPVGAATEPVASKWRI